MGKHKRHKGHGKLVKVPRQAAAWLEKLTSEVPADALDSLAAAARHRQQAPWPTMVDGSLVDPASLGIARTRDGELARPSLLAWDGRRWLLLDEGLAYAADLGDGSVPVDPASVDLVPVGEVLSRDA